MRTKNQRLLLPAIILAFAAALFACAPNPTLTVNTPDDLDDGTCSATHCSLREAINKANTLTGTVTIKFDIGGGGVQTIQPHSALPEIAVPVIIDGSTQPGFTSAPLIELDGSQIFDGIADGLVIKGGESEVKSLAINRFSGYGIMLGLLQYDHIWGCYIGTDITGTVAAGNHTGGVRIGGHDHEVGGATADRANVISGNLGDGVVDGGHRNQIRGNLIGVDVSGSAALGNQGNGIFIDGGARVSQIGGTAAGEGNIISGNHADGVRIEAPTVLVEGNYIGTDITGTVGLGNQGDGVRIATSYVDIVIGGTDPGAMNVISANGLQGIQLEGTLVGAQILGNRIGTNAAGTAALGNGQNGILVDGADHKIGSADDGSGNLISGNGEAGILVLATAVGVEIKNNYIGTDATGTAAIGNAIGIVADSALGGYDSVAIGGAVIAPNQANVISGNIGEGMVLYNKTRVWGNKIGTNAAGTGSLGNGGDGILVKSSGNLIGAINSGNTIAYNDGNGVAVLSGSGSAQENTIQVNQIYENAGLGIVIDEDAVIPNDYLDADTGDNARQNYPVLNVALADIIAGTTTIKGELDSAPATPYEIQFFSNAACDPSGYGEGQSMFDHITVTTNTQGHADFSTIAFSTSFIGGNFFTATATDPSGNTSEFSNCVPMTEVSPAAATPMPEGLTFTPFVDPAEIFYGRGGCTPIEVRIGVEIGDPPEPVSYVLLFVRLMDPATGETGSWSEGLSMMASGKNAYFYDLLAEDVPEYPDFAEAVLKYQFVAYNEAQEVIGRSEVYGDILFKRCGVPGMAG
jgi:CSLREA domain-containing protein